MYQIYFTSEWQSNSSISYPLAGRQQYLFDICLLLYVQSWTADDGRKDRPKYVECFLWLWNLVADITGGKEAEGVSEHGVENIWT